MSGGEIRLLTGGDASLLADAVSREVDALAGDIDRSTEVHEFSGDEYSVDELAIAAATPPLFSPHRLVVGRGLARFSAAALTPLVEYLERPIPTTALVLEWGSGRLPKSLAEAVTGAGGKKVATAAPTARKARTDWLDEKVKASKVKLNPEAVKLIDFHMGEEMSRVNGLLEILKSTFGGGAKLQVADIEPYLGAEGGVPPWDLTDAIDAGNISAALKVLQRMWQSDRAPLQVMATLINHYNNIVRLDGSGARNQGEAAEVLGMNRNAYPAKKALANASRLGRRKTVRAIELLATADVGLRGGTGLDPRCVMEVLAGRLANLSRR